MILNSLGQGHGKKYETKEMIVSICQFIGTFNGTTFLDKLGK